MTFLYRFPSIKPSSLTSTGKYFLATIALPGPGRNRCYQSGIGSRNGGQVKTAPWVVAMLRTKPAHPPDPLQPLTMPPLSYSTNECLLDCSSLNYVICPFDISSNFNAHCTFGFVLVVSFEDRNWQLHRHKESWTAGSYATVTSG